MNSRTSLTWLELKKVAEQSFIKAQVIIESKPIIIQFTIDQKTARGFNELFKKRPFKRTHDSQYVYKYAGYSLNQAKTESTHYIEIRLGKKRHKAAQSENTLFSGILPKLEMVV